MGVPSWIRRLFVQPQRGIERPKSRRSVKRRSRDLLSVESLEDRIVPTLYSPADDAVGLQNHPGSFSLTATDTLRIDIAGKGDAGTAYDRLDITGSGAKAELGGKLEVKLLNNFTPSSGDRFTVLSDPEFAGTFAEIVLPELGEGLQLVPVVGPTELTLVASSTASGKTPLYTRAAAPGGKLLDFFGKVGVKPPAVDLTEVTLTALGQTIRGNFSFGAATVNGALSVVAAASRATARCTVAIATGCDECSGIIFGRILHAHATLVPSLSRPARSATHDPKQTPQPQRYSPTRHLCHHRQSRVFAHLDPRAFTQAFGNGMASAR